MIKHFKQQINKFTKKEEAGYSRNELKGTKILQFSVWYANPMLITFCPSH